MALNFQSYPGSRERWELLMRDDSAQLTPGEIEVGWHFCAEMDGLLIGPGWGELEFCECLSEDHPAYQTLQ